MTERIEKIKIDSLIPFENHPFKERTGEEQAELVESIRTTGMLVPVIVRPLLRGKYEIISGHRRVAACRELGIDTVSAIVKELTKEEAVITMVDANLQRENLLPSEKAFAYKMKVEAMKRKAGRPPKNLSQVATNIDTATEIGQQLGESRDQVYRYIRLTYLIPELLKMVDEQRIAFTPAVEISYLPEREQRVLIDEIEYTDATPSLSQAQRLRKFSNQGRLSVDTVFAVLSEEKPNQREQVRFMTEDIRKYFPKNYSNKDMQKTIIKLLENWQRKRERNAREER
ncbi:ParB/RepB/Spo0J family partition protein [uncultured Eubacterium sp.]|uniref:ParB/RepB/Spo0J family partition protein n=1 Tax=uncultured Eubacterium sp. TaxID=165185 RepID=UPI0028037CED|nr:ParB/RepB/Spo0J family partition protein [uncultured Eubacterium sp.]